MTKKTAPSKQAVSRTPLLSTASGETELAESDGYMTPVHLAYFKQVLLDWFNAIVEENAKTVGDLQAELSNFPDPVDRAVQEEGFDLALKSQERKLRLKRKIEKALHAIDANDYGYCIECGAEIGLHRLKLRPTAEKCIDCKTFDEVREKQEGRS